MKHLAWLGAAIMLGLLLVYGARPAAAQTGAPTVSTAIEVSSVVTPLTLTVGDVVTLTVSITHPAGMRVVPLARLNPSPAIELLASAPPQIEPIADGREQTRLPLRITAWTPGTLSVAPADLTLSDGAGGLSVLPVPPVALTVVSVLAPGDDVPTELRPQAGLPLPPIWPAVLGGTLAVGTAAVGIGFWLGRRQRADAPASARPLPPPHLEALAAIDRIERADYLALGDYQAHYAGVADALRRYIEGEYHIDALERTTAELRRTLDRDAHMPIAARQQLITLLVSADFVKFARLQPPLEAARALPEAARQIVRASHTHKTGAA